MRYSVFAKHVTLKTRIYKIYLITGRTGYIRDDIMYLLDKKMQLGARSTFVDIVRRTVLNLADIKDDLDCLILNSDFNTIHLEWVDGILDKRRTKKLLKTLASAKQRYYVIIDQEEVLEDTFKEVFENLWHEIP